MANRQGLLKNAVRIGLARFIMGENRKGPVCSSATVQWFPLSRSLTLELRFTPQRLVCLTDRLTPCRAWQ